MPYFLRSWTDRDAGSDREISHSIYPEYLEDHRHPAWFPAQQLGSPREWASRYVAVETHSGERVAYATLWELRPRRYRFDLAVRPEWQRQGIATQLLTHVMSDAKALGATGLQARVRDDKLEAFEFVTRRGFRESHRMGAYRLNFTQADMPGCQAAFARLRDRDVEVTTLAVVREQDPDHLEKFFELYSAAREGWPDPDPDPTGQTSVDIDSLKRWLEDAIAGRVLHCETRPVLHCVYEFLRHWHGCTSEVPASRNCNFTQGWIDYGRATPGLSGADHLHSQSGDAEGI